MKQPTCILCNGHWTLLAINTYNETIYYFDSLRTTSKVDIRM